ncbi:MAG: cupin domain-containing protein [Syntrophales bacterium]|nr:cupin domain-containing protein [Syntrophales bacterium]
MNKRHVFNWIMVVCLGFSLILAAPAKAATPVDQILTQVDDILKANPMSPADKLQMIPVVNDDTTTIYVARLAEGGIVKPHFHKTHNEMVYVIKGSGQMLINGKWVDVKAGTFHYNPMNKVHSTKNTGKDQMVIFSIFTPPLKEPDRQFVE